MRLIIDCKNRDYTSKKGFTMKCHFCNRDYPDIKAGFCTEEMMFSVLDATIRNDNGKNYYCHPLCYFDRCRAQNRKISGIKWSHYECFYKKNTDIFSECIVQSHRREIENIPGFVNSVVSDD
jgi:hypothetical protein